MSKSARIIGVGGYHPPLLSNQDFIDVFGKKAVVAGKKMTHQSRYLAIDLKTGKVAVSNTEMAYHAAQEALKMAKLEPNAIEMIIYSSSTPDYPLPPSFTLLQEKLAIKQCMGFDIRSGCSGFGTGLVTALQFIKTGMAQRVMVVGADLTSSRFSFLFNRGIKDFPLKALFNLMLFGDGAGAIILEATEDENAGIFGATMGSTKPQVAWGSIIKIGGAAAPFPSEDLDEEEWTVIQNGPLTASTVPQVLSEALEQFFQRYQLQPDDFDSFIFPVETEIIKAPLQHLKMDWNKVISIGPTGGSLVNAAVPLTLAKALQENRVKKGDQLLIYAAENTKWQHALIGLNWSLD